MRLAPVIAFLWPHFLNFNLKWGRVYIFLFTFAIYTLFHLSRKPLGVVQSVLHNNCTNIYANKNVYGGVKVSGGWKPFDGDDYDLLFGILDVIYLGFYAVSMFPSGHMADKFDLRVFLCLSSMFSGLMTIAFGMGYFLNIHYLSFYIVVQILTGIVQGTAWPAVVATLTNWCEKKQRGFLMGVWNAHTSLGNILGSLIAGAFVEVAWGWSFVVPGLMIIVCGVVIYLFLVPYPELVGIRSLKQHDAQNYESARQVESFIDRQVVQHEQFAENPSISTVDTYHHNTYHFDHNDDRDNDEDNNIDRELLLSENCMDSVVPPTYSSSENAASFLTVLSLPGVLEFAMSLFFSKMVAYSFLYWLPIYIKDNSDLNASDSAYLSTVFDLGGIMGSILAGYVSDRTNASAITCTTMLILAIPSIYLYSKFTYLSATRIGLLIPLGMFIVGPYCLITTAVSADLGTHPSLSSNTRALATVSGIIDGTGSIGAAFGPLLCSLLKPYGWYIVIYILMCSLSVSVVLLSRLVFREFRRCFAPTFHHVDETM